MRRDVYRLRPARDSLGYEQQGPRYGVVIQASQLEHWSTWVIVPTSTSARAGRLRPEIDFGRGPTVAMVDAMVAFDPAKRLGEHVGSISREHLQAIHRSMERLFDVKLRDGPLPRGRRPRGRRPPAEEG